MKTVLITGAAGFIGSNLVDFMLKENYKVIGVDRRRLKTKNFYHDNYTHRYSDLDEVFKLDVTHIHQNDLKDVDVIFHLAADARIKPSIKAPEQYYYNNFNSTISIIKMARERNIPIIFASSSSLSGDPCANPYTNTKYLAEQMFPVFRKTFGMNICSVRFFNVYGPGQIEQDSDRATLIGRWLSIVKKDKYSKLTVRGDGSQSRDFTHVWDICHGLYHIYHTGQHLTNELFDLGSMHPYTIESIANIFKEIWPTITIAYDKTAETISFLAQAEVKTTLADHNYIPEGWKPLKNLERYLQTTGTLEYYA